jgi:hypothetical protein
MTPALALAALISLAAAGGAPNVPDAAQLATIETRAELAPAGDGKLVISIVPTGTKDAPTHLETAFPVKVTLTAPEGLAVPKPALTKADAARLERKEIRFDVPFKAAAPGKHPLKGRVKFAVCVEDPKTTETLVCLPQDRELSYVVEVK